MNITPQQIARLSADEVDDLFRGGEITQIPDGDARGTAIFRPGSPVEPLTQRLVEALLWQGKVIDARAGALKNKIFPLSVHAIEADVYPARSWFDGQECIVLDYSERSILARWIRDEIRRVAPGLYLGLVYLGSRRLIYFTLQFTV